MEGKASLNSFGTFLESGSARRDSSPDSVASRGDKTLVVLRALEKGPKHSADLLRATRMGVIDFAESLKTLQGIALIKVTGPEEDQKVELTRAGSELLPQIL